MWSRVAAVSLRTFRVHVGSSEMEVAASGWINKPTGRAAGWSQRRCLQSRFLFIWNSL